MLPFCIGNDLGFWVGRLVSEIELFPGLQSELERLWPRWGARFVFELSRVVLKSTLRGVQKNTQKVLAHSPACGIVVDMKG